MHNARTHRQGGRRGQAATLFALMVPTLMGSAAFGVDYGLVTVAQYQVQAVADAAALAATTTMDDESAGLAIAQAYARQMSVNGVSVEIDTIEYGYWDSGARSFEFGNDDLESNAVRVTTKAAVPMHLARIFDIQEAQVRGVAGAGPKVVPQRAPDTVVVLDTTLSMNSAEIRSEREALDALVECVYERSSPDSRVSIVLFGGVDTKVIDMTEYGTNWGQIRSAVAQVQSCNRSGPFNPCSHTNPSSGYEAALSILANADTPPEIGQAIVMMSDGEPTVNNIICSDEYLDWYDDGHFLFPLRDRCSDAEYTYRDRRGRLRTGYNISSSDLDNWALTARASAESAGVDVYTTFYGPNTYSGEMGSRWLANHVTTGDGSHHRALTRDEIADTFVDICVEFTGGSAGMLF